MPIRKLRTSSGLLGPAVAAELGEVLQNLAENDQSIVAELSGSDLDVDDGVPMAAGATGPSASASSSSTPGVGASAASSSGPAAANSRWAHLGIVEMGWRCFFTPEGRPLGRLHNIGPDGLKATCRRHHQCACWLTKPTDKERALGDLVEWVARASDDSQAHSQAAFDVKVKHGMKLRQPRQPV